MNLIQEMIKDICLKKHIKFNLVSKDWIMVLEKEEHIKYIIGYKFPLNDYGASEVCNDKYALYEVLKKYHIPVAEHHILFKNYDKEEVKNYAFKYNYDMVVKSNTGTCGNSMYHTEDLDSLYNYIDKLLIKNYSISVLPYYEIKTEYRTVILDNKVELFYGKRKPIVIGDGIHTIYELLCQFNPIYFKKISKEGLDRILAKDEIYEYNWQFNLSKGAIPFNVNDDDLKEKITNMALQVVKTLGIKFASIDIIELYTGELLVLESNCGVMMENYALIMPNGKEIVYEIYNKAIDMMFN